MPDSPIERDREKTALYIRSAWDSLLTPNWQRDDLELLGKLVFAKAKLAALDNDVLGRVLPYLKSIATDLAPRVLSNPPLDDASVATYIRAIWNALTTPSWNRKDLIDLGISVHAKTPLGKLDQNVFDRLLPKLTEIANHLKPQFARVISVPPAAPTPAVSNSEQSPPPAAEGSKT